MLQLQIYRLWTKRSWNIWSNGAILSFLITSLEIMIEWQACRYIISIIFFMKKSYKIKAHSNEAKSLIGLISQVMLYIVHILDSGYWVAGFVSENC